MKLRNEETILWKLEHQQAFEKIKECLSKLPVLISPKPNKPLKLYISASKDSIGSLLVHNDEKNVEQAIYYLSRTLTDVEKRYASIEKLCLALYF